LIATQALEKSTLAHKNLAKTKNNFSKTRYLATENFSQTNL
jgi:hypothetical protein